ncbi:60S ribosomal protein L27 [Prototheca wickerhamii]|uniref:60S ribosomal protein L27 n=1 Tax=Prototheca wickerhamii TaxID=3111 RepID=A0AAD9IG74_PROWI|nr:60S ribosomal protein L27 [Prototheca wickerhamii]
MVKFLKPGKVVILLTGRQAGKKAVIVKNFDDGHSSRPYGHALVLGLSKSPGKVTKSSSKKVQARRSKVKTFIKAVNYTHLMPTRYTLDVDVKGVVSPDSLESSTKRKASNKAAKKVLEEKFKTGKNRWFFTKLRF